MYGTLQYGSLPAGQRDRADEQGQRQQNDLLGRKAQHQRDVEGDGHRGHGGDGEADGGEGRTEGKIEAGLHAIAIGGVERCTGLRQQDEEGDGNADHGGRRPCRSNPMLDRRSQQLGKADDRHQCSHQQGQRRQGLAAAGPTTEGGVLAAIDREKEFPMAHGLDKDENAIQQQGHQAGEHHLRRGVGRPGRAGGEFGKDEYEAGEGDQNGERRGGAFDAESNDPVAPGAGREAEADDAVANDHHRREDRITGQRRAADGVREHHRHDQRHFDDGYGERQDEGAERFADAKGDDFRVEYRDDDRSDQTRSDRQEAVSGPRSDAGKSEECEGEEGERDAP